jgi:hypothetical protein
VLDQKTTSGGLRLRVGLSLNYPALGLVMDLLDRIEALEAALRATGARLPARRSCRGSPRSLDLEVTDEPA